MTFNRDLKFYNDPRSNNHSLAMSTCNRRNSSFPLTDCAYKVSVAKCTKTQGRSRDLKGELHRDKQNVSRDVRVTSNFPGVFVVVTLDINRHSAGDRNCGQELRRTVTFPVTVSCLELPFQNVACLQERGLPTSCGPI